MGKRPQPGGKNAQVVRGNSDYLSMEGLDNFTYASTLLGKPDLHSSCLDSYIGIGQFALRQ